MCVSAPPYRVDIQEGPADLIEDLARIHGYDRLPATLPADVLPEQENNRSLQLEERIKDILVNLGLQEVITYALTDPSREAPLGPSAGEFVRLLNPINVERGVMRQRLLPCVLEAAATNLKHAADVKLFELGPVFLPQPGSNLPIEPKRLALVLIGKRAEAFWAEGESAAAQPLDFYDLKGMLEALLAELHLPQPM